MSIYKKVNDTLIPINIYKYVNNNDTIYPLEVKNIFKKVNNQLLPIWHYDWLPGEWDECSKSCDGGTQQRTVVCNRKNDNVVKNEIYCNHIIKPPLEQECNKHSCVTWNSSCSITGVEGFTEFDNLVFSSGKLNGGQRWNLGDFTIPEKAKIVNGIYVLYYFYVYDVKGAIYIQYKTERENVNRYGNCMCSGPIQRHGNYSGCGYICFPNENRNGPCWGLALIPNEFIIPGDKIIISVYVGSASYSGRSISTNGSGRSKYMIV